ncbi:hypothetical protein C8_137, partial [Cannes 8 virus]
VPSPKEKFFDNRFFFGFYRLFEHMHRFLRKKETVSFCVCGGEEVLPKKEEYIISKTKKEGNIIEKAEILPDGTYHFLETRYDREVCDITKSGSKHYTIKTTQEFDGGVPHGKYRAFRVFRNGDEELEVEGDFRKGEAHGNFFVHSVENAVKYTCTLINGRVLEFSTQGRENAIISRNKKKGELRYLEKNNKEYEGALKVSRYTFRELEHEWPSACPLLFDIIFQKFRKYEYRSELVMPNSLDIHNHIFSNEPGEHFIPNKLYLMMIFVWVECPFTESKEPSNAKPGGSLRVDHLENPTTMIFV